MSIAEELLQEDLVDIYEGGDFKKLIEFAAKKLINLEYVRSTYIKAIQQREQEFPTGLVTSSYGVAIPHTDPSHIKKPFIYVIKSEQPIKFGQMGTIDEFVDVKYVFLLGFTKGADQLQLLQSLMTMFMNNHVMKELKEENNSQEILKIVNNFFIKESEEVMDGNS